MWVLLASSFDLYNDPVCFYELSILSTTTGLSAGLCGCWCWAEIEFKWLWSLSEPRPSDSWPNLGWNETHVLSQGHSSSTWLFHSLDTPGITSPTRDGGFASLNSRKDVILGETCPLELKKDACIDITSPCFWPFQESNRSRWACKISKRKIKLQCWYFGLVF